MQGHYPSIYRCPCRGMTTPFGEQRPIMLQSIWERESYNNPTIMSFCVIQNVVFIARCSLGTWVPFTSCHGKDNIANMIDVGSVKHMHDTSLQITHCRFLIDE